VGARTHRSPGARPSAHQSLDSHGVRRPTATARALGDRFSVLADTYWPLRITDRSCVAASRSGVSSQAFNPRSDQQSCLDGVLVTATSAFLASLNRKLTMPLRELFVGQQVKLDCRLTQSLILGMRLLGNPRRLLVANVRIERSHQHQRVVEVALSSTPIMPPRWHREQRALQDDRHRVPADRGANFLVDRNTGCE
jgi:hypothetical protein